MADTVHLLPGLRLGANSHNAAMLNVRGFDSRKTLVYVDGIPPYVPYDAMWISTASPRLIWPKCAWPVRHLALYGPSTLGGAVNLVTRKSARSLEGNARLGLTPVDGLSVDFGIANVGNKWYQLADGLPMPGCTWYVNLGYRFQRR